MWQAADYCTIQVKRSVRGADNNDAVILRGFKTVHLLHEIGDDACMSDGTTTFRQMCAKQRRIKQTYLVRILVKVKPVRMDRNFRLPLCQSLLQSLNLPSILLNESFGIYNSF